MNEEWRPVKDFECLYEVSSLGRVRSVRTGRLLKYGQSRNDGGYYNARLYKHSKQYSRKVHRLVAEAFIDNIDCKPTVNHIDGNIHNNVVENLEWATYSENVQHAHDTGLTSDKRKVQQVHNGVVLKTYGSLTDAARAVGCKKQAIFVACNSPERLCRGFSWRYADE